MRRLGGEGVAPRILAEVDVNARVKVGVGGADDGPGGLVLLAVLLLHGTDRDRVEGVGLDALASQRLAHLKEGTGEGRRG